MVEKDWSDDDVNDEKEEEEEEGMEEDKGDEAMENLEDANDEDGDGNFPHAYFFVRYVCERENCGGTLAPLPPSPEGVPSSVMECNACGLLKTEDNADQDGGEGSNSSMLD